MSKDQKPKLKDEKNKGVEGKADDGKQDRKKRAPNGRKYDLEERTAVFGEKIIDFVKTLLDNVVNRELIRQLVKAGTSAGANYN